ncbi:MAG: Mo-dependent nitrogenase C-terminal domain-containing protein [Microcoleaceae cyanobacterium MO_207.B10]|nr:Mo-dependent nitrogenase C-terminal domain-containing protein [Microcoleaceae cyanobacterium MO_207.B10]
MQATTNNYANNIIDILLQPGRNFINSININNPKFAQKLCQLIPAQCPFARDIKFLGRTILQIPPMCKLNPFYDEIISLRFRALTFLADVCLEDITPYC